MKMTLGFFIDQTIVKAPIVVSIAFQGFTMTQKSCKKWKLQPTTITAE